MRVIFFLLFCTNIQTLKAQTKKIAFKSHSGNMAYFHLALESNSGDIENSNFGMAPEPMVKSAQLDSVILISDSVAVMKTSKYCRWKEQPESEARRWKGGGADTVINHPLFSGYLSLDSIKTILRTQYHFRNPVEQVVFVGFEEPVTSNRQKIELLIAGSHNNDHTRFDGRFMIMTSLIFGLICFGACRHVPRPLS